MYITKNTRSIVRNFAINFFGLMFAPMLGQTPEGNVPRAKDLRSAELVSELKAKAEAKRERKRDKRISDQADTEINQYNNHYQTN